MKSNYIKDSFAELTTKVAWPPVSSLQSSAVLVMVASLILALVILAMDTTFENVMAAIYSMLA